MGKRCDNLGMIFTSSTARVVRIKATTTLAVAGKCHQMRVEHESGKCHQMRVEHESGRGSPNRKGIQSIILACR